jgi:hypothetical protein
MKATQDLLADSHFQSQFHLTAVDGASYFGNPGGAMRQAHCMFILLLLGTVVCASSVPPEDDPTTAIDESDLQVNIGTPAPLRMTLVHPVANSIDLPKLALCLLDCRINSDVHGLARTLNQHSPRSLQDLLCSFLI